MLNAAIEREFGSCSTISLTTRPTCNNIADNRNFVVVCDTVSLFALSFVEKRCCDSHLCCCVYLFTVFVVGSRLKSYHVFLAAVSNLANGLSNCYTALYRFSSRYVGSEFAYDWCTGRVSVI